MKNTNFFRSPRQDEMGRHILLLSQRNGYLFLMSTLAVWTFYESWRVFAHRARLNIVPCLLLSAAAVVQSVSQTALTRRAVRGDEEAGDGRAPRLVLLILGVAAVAATVCAAVALWVVKP